ncbi:LuxR C-terminal-related transcriptional regulator [Thiorhodococcus fuscus]|uniref:LuxR C-terminal-related transcriptional regulator n=1 Tax=Thiorhodococcus fuscus TaxID=527200 RepID=A0ABW4YCN2_9GAMM
MSEPASPKRRGRPSTGRALSPAERMRAVRERARAVAFDEYRGDFSAMSDTGLIEILTTAYRKGMTQAAADAVVEMFRRMNPRAVAGMALTPTFQPATTADLALSETVAEKPVGQKRKTSESGQNETVAKNSETPEDAPELRSAIVEPVPLSERDRQIVELYHQGLGKRPIARQLGISDGTIRSVLKRHGAD